MTRRLVKYRLENGHVPSYIADGGHFPTVDGYLHGITIDPAPDGLTELSEQDLSDLIDAVNAAATTDHNNEKVTFSKGEWKQGKPSFAGKGNGK